MKASDIIIHRKLMEQAVVKRHQRIMETAAKYWKAVDERLARQQRKKEERMKNKYRFENGETYEYDSESFERFYKDFKIVKGDVPTFLESDMLRKWVKAHGTRVPNVEIKKGDFIAVFRKCDGYLVKFNYAFTRPMGIWYGRLGGEPLQGNEYRTFICPVGAFLPRELPREDFVSAANPLIPRTIEEAEMFCQEVTE